MLGAHPNFDCAARRYAICPASIRQIVWSCLVCAPVAIALIVPRHSAAQIEYDPEHPVVQEMIEKGLNYMIENPSGLIGNRVMMGMAAYKANILRSPRPKEHPLIEAALQAIETACTEGRLRNSSDFSKMYASALAAVFLLELDPEEHKEQIEILLDHIVERQQRSGAWGYRQYPTAGDTSQMQYIALALWLAEQNGFKVSPNVSKRGLQWLIETQQQGGGWIYQVPAGIMPTSRGPDRDVRHSLVAAGLGAVYLFADALKLTDRSSQGMLAKRTRDEEFDLPPSVQDITNQSDQQTTTAQQRRALVSFDTAAMRQSMSEGNRWFRQNFRVDPDKYNMYYMYGFERYASLHEYVDGDLPGLEDWYDRGVRHLKRIQTSAGNFPGEAGDVSDAVKTAFGILFLTRSMQITINDRARGLLNGGEGFPKDTILREKQGEIISSAERSVRDFLELMENPDNDELANLKESFEQLNLDGDETSRSEQKAKMRMLVKHSNFHARLAAVRFLGNLRDLDSVPALLFALTDPDPRVAIAANDALKFVSRKTSGFEISDDPTETEIKALSQKWTEWYRHVRPGADLLEQ